tara:strand:- start:645 stop:926 length:282 start_codon:yes stop_codon:yes gene_type:complete
MSPHVSNKDEKEKKTKTNNHLKKIREDLLKMRSFVEKNFEYVGKDFTKEVRKIYYDKKSNKNIYGNATDDEAQELVDEGIELTSIPWIDKRDN